MESSDSQLMQRGGGGSAYFNSTAGGGQSNMLSDLFNLGVGLYGANDKSYSNNINNLASTAQQMADPFAGQRGQYMNLLNQSYTNPQAVYDSQYSAMDKTFYNDMMTNASMTGRTTDAYKHGLAREGAFQDYLSKYRNQLAQLAGGNANPSAGAYADLASKALANNNQNNLNSIYAGSSLLNNLLGGNRASGSQSNPLSSLFGAAGSGLSSLWDYVNDPYTYNGNYDSLAGTYTGSGTTYDDLLAGGYNGSGGNDYWSDYTSAPSNGYYDELSGTWFGEGQ